MSPKILPFLFVLNSISAQQSLLRFEILQGANMSFIGDAGEGKHIGYSAGYGFSYSHRKKKSVVSFEPQLIISINKYIFHINNDCDLQIRHRVSSFMPMAGILMTKSISFKAGVFINTGEVSKLSLAYNQGPTTNVSPDNWNYYPNRIQAGFVIGMSGNLGQKKRWNYNILLEQFANSIIDKDIELQGVAFRQPYNSIFSNKCKPSLILLGISYVLTKFEREKTQVE